MKDIQKPIKLKKIVAILVTILAIVLTIALVITFWPKAQTNNPESGENVPTVEIETPYCVLRYPEQWKDKMTVKESTVDGMLVETFCAVVEGESYALYTVYFGDSPTGDLFGYIKRDEKSIPVYIECHNLADSDSFPEKELPLFYAMMEGVNEVANSIAAASGYYKK